MTIGIPGTSPGTGWRPQDEDADAGTQIGGREEPVAGTRSSRSSRGNRAPARPELAGAVRLRHGGRDYVAWYRVIDDLLTVYCGLASNTGLFVSSSPSPKPLAERLLRELIDAEHPGLNPE